MDDTSERRDADGPRDPRGQADAGGAAPAGVADAVRSIMDEVPAAEMRVARTLLAAYPTAGLGSAADLAARAGVSAPTVVRFASRLGLGGYRGMQRALREEVQRERSASPVTIPRGDRPEAWWSDAAELFDSTVGRTFADVPRVELDRAVAALADRRRRVVLVGGRYTRLLAQYLDLHLRQMRERTSVLDEPSRRAAFLAGVGRDDVVVVFDVRRYQRDVVELGRYVHEQGATVVLVTDPWLSPLATDADVVLPVRVEGPSPFDSIVPATALVEALIAGVLHALGEPATQRVRVAEELTDDDLTH